MNVFNTKTAGPKTKLLIAAGLVYLMFALIGAIGWYHLSAAKSFVEETHGRGTGVHAGRKGEAAVTQAGAHKQRDDNLHATYRQAQWVAGGLLGGVAIFTLVLVYYRKRAARLTKRLAK